MDALEFDLNALARIGVVLLLSGVLGWERERAGKAAGLRTHMLVGAGTALFVITGELLVMEFGELDMPLRFDLIGIIQAVVGGVGFLGAGLIFVSRSGDRVQGLTTAASLWATSGVAMVAALERYLLAAVATALIFAVLHLLSYVERRASPGADP